MNLDPKFLIVGVCILAISIALALIQRLMRRRPLEDAIAPRPMAMAPQAMAAATLLADTGNARPGAVQTKTIAIIHDFGLPDNQRTEHREYLTVREAFEVLAQIRSVDANTPIDIVLHTPGGSAFACELIATALKDRPKTTAYVPYCAMSAGTIIALATEKVVMGDHACLGPIDLQLGPFAAESFIRLTKEKPIKDVDDFFVLLGYLAEKDLKSAKRRACELLNKKHFGSDEACQLTDFLISGDLPHSEQISRQRAKELGVNVAKEDCPEAVFRMVDARLELLAGGNGSNPPSTFDPDFKAKDPR